MSKRVPSWIQPVSVKESPDSAWQIADQYGVCIMHLGWYRCATQAHRVLMQQRATEEAA